MHVLAVLLPSQLCQQELLNVFTLENELSNKQLVLVLEEVHLGHDSLDEDLSLPYEDLILLPDRLGVYNKLESCFVKYRVGEHAKQFLKMRLGLEDALCSVHQVKGVVSGRFLEAFEDLEVVDVGQLACQTPDGVLAVSVQVLDVFRLLPEFVILLLKDIFEEVNFLLLEHLDFARTKRKC